jgi:hypothetical protein
VVRTGQDRLNRLVVIRVPVPAVTLLATVRHDPLVLAHLRDSESEADPAAEPR